MNIWKGAATDFDNATVDTGRLCTLITICAMVVAQIMSTWLSPEHKFDAQSFGTGVGAALLGLGGYIWGDAKGKQAQA